MLNLLDPTFIDQRHERYAELRDSAPVAPVSMGPLTAKLLTRYDDVAQVLRNPDITVRPASEDIEKRLGDGAALRMHRVKMSLQDAPMHTRLRSLVNNAFSPAAVAKLRARIETIVSELLDELAEKNEIDVASDLGARVPQRIICAIAGIPEDDWNLLIGKVEDFLLLLAPFPLDDDGRGRVDAVCQFYFDYFGEHIARVAEGPKREDLLGHLMAAEENGDRLSRVELVSLLESFVNAGYETTAASIASGVLGLARKRDTWQRLGTDPRLAAPAVTEVLRWDAPVQFILRYLPEPATLHGNTIEPGELVMLGLAAANRDPRVFAHPNEVDVDRKDVKVMSFGGGRHFCLGNHLARLEAEIALSQLAARFPRLEFLTEPRRRPNPMFPAIDSLKVRLNP